MTFWGSFYRCWPNLVCYSRHTVYAYVPNFISIGLFCRPLPAKSQILAVFWTSAFSGVANWQQSEKVEHGCTTTTASKSFLYSNAFMAKSGTQSLTFKSVRNKQTDRQKTQHFWPPLRRVKSEPNQTWHGGGDQSPPCQISPPLVQR